MLKLVEAIALETVLFLLAGLLMVAALIAVVAAETAFSRGDGRGKLLTVVPYVLLFFVFVALTSGIIIGSGPPETARGWVAVLACCLTPAAGLTLFMYVMTEYLRKLSPFYFLETKADKAEGPLER